MKQLDPKYVWQFFLITFFSLLIPVFILTMVTLSENNLPPSDLVVICIEVSLGLAIISWIFAKLTYRFYKYELKKEGFRKEAGIIWKEYHTIPYNRIQNVDIYRGILDRLLGLSRILIQTAGSGNLYLQEGKLPGLSIKAAEQLRDELINRVNKTKTGEF